MSFEIKNPAGIYDPRYSRRYIMDRGEVDLLALKTVEPDTGNPFGSLFENLSDGNQYIYSLRVYPFDILEKCKPSAGSSYYNGIVDGTTGSGDKLDPINPDATMLKCINLGDYIAYKYAPVAGTIKPSITENIDGISKTLCGAVMSNDFDAKIFVGNVLINPKYNNFLDYAPYTKLELYLPFYGLIELDPELAMNKRININYVIDYGDGTATAYITNNDGVLIKNVTFKIALEIPVDQTNAMEIKRNNALSVLNTTIGVGAAVGGTIASGGSMAALALGYGANTVSNTINNYVKNKPKISKGSELGGEASWYGPTTPFLIITRSIPKETELYNFMYGKPSEASIQLVNEINSGNFFIVDEIHLEGFNTATSTEIDMIEKALKSGVIG